MNTKPNDAQAKVKQPTAVEAGKQEAANNNPPEVRALLARGYTKNSAAVFLKNCKPDEVNQLAKAVPGAVAGILKTIRQRLHNEQKATLEEPGPPTPDE